MNILILGVSGMLGSAMFRILSHDVRYKVIGTVRSSCNYQQLINGCERSTIICDVDVEREDSLLSVFGDVSPDVVINCVGLVKQLADADNPLLAVPINSLLPHRLAAMCKVAKSRLIHISTDCVFSGKKGLYQETDVPDAYDLYGRTKLIGEVNYPHAVTLRTSIIGHELKGSRSLLCWFLSQEGSVKGYAKAVFSGLPTDELARVVRDYVIPRSELSGLYHVSSKPIDKLSLLNLIADAYSKQIDIIPDTDLVIDRSLCSDRFTDATGYIAPEWPELIHNMHVFSNREK